GLEWREVPAQSTRLATYRAAAERLEREGLLYRCSATRGELAGLPKRRGEDGVEYPGKAKDLGRAPQDGEAFALRLDLDAAMERVGEVFWKDREDGAVRADPRAFGDVVLVRKELPASYHLAATLDDAADAVTLVTRGRDLFASTHVHRVVQELLGLPVPAYLHHDLILDADGAKLAKSQGSPALAQRRLAGEDGRALARELLERYLNRTNTAGT
ncbi:MAG: glutamate--tRNA ligase family protein, partial [Pseudomonadota bacterium]